jgi:hypothetical protein
LTFTASASDPEDGPVFLITWTDNRSAMNGGRPATTFTRTHLCTELGNHNVAATAQDTGNLTGTDTITINIYDPAIQAAPTKLKASASKSGTVTPTFIDNATNETGFRLDRRPKGSTSRNYSRRLAAKTGTGTVTTTDASGSGS